VLIPLKPVGMSIRRLTVTADGDHSARPLTFEMKSATPILALAALLFVAPELTIAQESAKPADNTKVNKRDRKSGAVTADQQKENVSDREITANIRKALMDNKELSTYAHNVKVIARNGMVTLKGPVRSEDEKKTIEAKATEIAGEGKVKSMISVKPKS
jgi:hyperosmotically inducible periplasmic protein